MHLQNFFFVVLVASIFQYCYSAGESSTTPAPRVTGSTRPQLTREEWDFDRNYRYDENKYKNYYGKNPSYNNDDDDEYGSGRNKPSYNNDDDHEYGSGRNKPSYNNDDDHEYRSGNNKPSHKDDDDDDYKPSRSSRHRKSPDELGNIHIYMNEPSKDGRKRKPKRIRFPVARYERNRFPSFGPLISLLPWLPIFTDRLTKQTFIYSPTGGIYIIPPVINFYGDLISVAELIASGYASLVSTGAPPPPAVNIAPLVHPAPVVGPGVPPINPATGGFKGGVRTQYRYAPRPNYPKSIEVDEPYYPQKDQGGYYSQQDQGRSYQQQDRRPSYSGNSDSRSQKARPNYGSNIA